MLVVILALSSCYREELVAEESPLLFELEISEAKRKALHESRDSVISISPEEMSFSFQGEELAIDALRTRGESAQRYRRKSFSVFLDRDAGISHHDLSRNKDLERFKLIAMAMDYTYIENRVGFGLLEKLGLMPLLFSYAELKINGSTEGLYLLVEDPEEYFVETGAEVIIRRGYNHRIDDLEYQPGYHYLKPAYYEGRYHEIYDSLAYLEGEALFHYLDQRLNMESYFRKMAVDYLLRNGDYTDELYLYSQIKDSLARFEIIPWDYDDLFSDKPHEVGTSWGTGSIYGKRYYGTEEEVREVTGDQLIYSIEDDLDYTIATDPVLAAHYALTLQNFLQEISSSMISDVFRETVYELEAYYWQNDIISQSKYDKKQTNQKIWEAHVKEMEARTLERLSEMKRKVGE